MRESPRGSGLPLFALEGGGATWEKAHSGAQKRWGQIAAAFGDETRRLAVLGRLPGSETAGGSLMRSVASKLRARGTEHALGAVARRSRGCRGLMARGTGLDLRSHAMGP